MSYGMPPNGMYPPQNPSTVSEDTKTADSTAANSLLFVGALSPETCSREHIIELFSIYGPLVAVNHNRSAGCAFVLFQRPDDSLRALTNLQRFGFHGRQLEVRFANPDAAPLPVPPPPVPPQFPTARAPIPLGGIRPWGQSFNGQSSFNGPPPPASYNGPQQSHYNGAHVSDYNGGYAPDYNNSPRPPLGGPRGPRPLNAAVPPQFRPQGSGFFGGGSAYGHSRPPNPRPPPRPLFGNSPMGAPSPLSRPNRPPRWPAESPNQFRPRQPWRPENPKPQWTPEANQQPPQWTPEANQPPPQTSTQPSWVQRSSEVIGRGNSAVESPKVDSPVAAPSRRTPSPPPNPNAAPSPPRPSTSAENPNQQPSQSNASEIQQPNAPEVQPSESQPESSDSQPRTEEAADESSNSPPTESPSPPTLPNATVMPSNFPSVSQLPDGNSRRRRRGGQKERERRQRLATTGAPGAEPPQPLHSARPFGAFAPQPLASIRAIAPSPRPPAQPRPPPANEIPTKRPKIQSAAGSTELLPHPQSEERLAEGAPMLDGEDTNTTSPPQEEGSPTETSNDAESNAAEKDSTTPQPLNAKQQRIQEANEKKIQMAIRKIWRDVTDEDGAILDQNEIPDMFVCGGCHLITSNAEFFFNHRQLPCDRKPIDKRANEEPIVLVCNECGINCRNSWDLLVHLAHTHGICMYEEDELQTIEYPDIQLAPAYQPAD